MPETNSRILQEMQETMNGLHEVGLIDRRRMSEFSALCNLDVHAMSPEAIRAFRVCTRKATDRSS